MQNKINLDTHNEVMPVSEPWHRGSGFTWMLLGLAGLVFFLSGVAAKAGGDIFDGYIQINGTWYNVGGVNDGRNNPNGSANASGRTLLSNANFGTQNFGGFNLTGFQINGWTSFGTGVDNNGANYRVWRSGDTKPSSYTNFWNTTSETYYSGGDYLSSVTSQSTGIIGDTFLNGQTYNLEVQTYTVLTGDNAGSKFYERTGTFTVNGARQEVDISSNANQSGVYNTSVAGGVVKKGSATLTLTENNSNATTGQKGEIYIDAGTVAVNPNSGVTGNQALGGSGAIVRLGATSGSATAGFALTDSDGGLDVGRQIVVRSGSSGTKTISASNSSGINTLSGTITLDDNVTISGASGSGILDLTGKIEDGTGAGTFATTFSTGTVRLSGGSANSGISGATVNNGATLVLNKTAGVDALGTQLTIDSGGTVRADSANQLGGSLVNNSGTLNLNGNNQTLRLTGSGGVSLGSAQMTISTTGTDTASGAITGTGSVVKSGTGTLTLTGNNNYSGGTTISGGTLVGSTTSIQGAVANNAALELSQNTDGTYSGALSGAGTLVKKGTGNVTLGSSNSGYSGGVYIDAGTLSAGEGAGFGTGSVFLGQDGVSSTATVAIGDANGGTSVGNDVVVRAGGGTRTITSANTSGSNTFSGNVYLDGNVSLNSSTGGRLILSGRLDDGLGAGNFTATITAGSVEFAGSSSNQNLTSYTVNSGAELRMNKSSADAVQSTLNINNGGTATLVAANQLGSGATVNNSGTLATGGNSDTFGTLNSSGNITGNGTLTAGTYSITGGTVSANLGNGTLTASGNSTINGNTTASTMNVTGDTTLNGTSSATTVAVSGNGTDLNLGSGGNRLSSSADVTVGAGSKLNITSNQALGSVKETGTSNGGEVNIGSGAKLTINGADKGTLFQNTISGAGDLEMAGSGTTSLALYGTQSYTGSTTVSGGKISTAVALATAGVTVSGGTFETTAADILGNGASVNISSGTYSLGGSDTVGSLTISGGTLSGSSTLTAATYALQGGTVGANLGAGAATASTGATALNGNLTGSLEATGGTVNAAGTIGGNVTVSGGTVNLSAADRIANGAAVSVSSGTLGMGANNDTVGSFSISGGTLGGTGKLTAATYGLSGGTVNANLGAGTVNANSGTTSLNGSVDATTVNVGGGTLNLGSGGRLATGATANVTSGTLSTGGNETITRLNATGGTVNLTDDTLTVTGTGGNASSVGTSATVTGGTISVAGVLDYEATSGSSALTIASGGTLTGAGTTTGKLTVQSGGNLALGNSPGTMSVGSADWLGGGTYSWEINSLTGGAGDGWDLLDVNGLLDIQATSASPFVIALMSLDSGNSAGALAGFNENTNYSFAIAYYDTLGGFAANKFTFDTTGFGNYNTLNGAWSISTSAGTGVSGQNELLLNYTTNYSPSGAGGGGVAIPEPSVASMFVLGLSALLANRRRRA